MSYSISWLENGVYVKAKGIYTLEDNLKANGELYGDPRFEDLKFQIGDFIEADTSGITLKTANIVGKMESVSTVWNNDMRVAHITKDQELLNLLKLMKSTWLTQIGFLQSLIIMKMHLNGVLNNFLYTDCSVTKFPESN